jgi:hypothetical protein
VESIHNSVVVMHGTNKEKGRRRVGYSFRPQLEKERAHSAAEGQLAANILISVPGAVVRLCLSCTSAEFVCLFSPCRGSSFIFQYRARQRLLSVFCALLALAEAAARPFPSIGCRLRIP